MATKRRYSANRQLTWERLERGWSHEELCEQIKGSMREAGRGRHRADRKHGAPVGNRRTVARSPLP